MHFNLRPGCETGAEIGRLPAIPVAASGCHDPLLSCATSKPDAGSRGRRQANPFDQPLLWACYRFRDYFRREYSAIFFDRADAERFALRNIGGEHGNGYYVTAYRRPDWAGVAA